MHTNCKARDMYVRVFHVQDIHEQFIEFTEFFSINQSIQILAWTILNYIGLQEIVANSKWILMSNARN